MKSGVSFKLPSDNDGIAISFICEILDSSCFPLLGLWICLNLFSHLSIILYVPKLMKKGLVPHYWGLLLTFLGIHPKFLAKSSIAPNVSHFLTGEFVIIKKSGSHCKSNPASHPNLPIKKWVFCTLTEICMKFWFRPCTLWQLLILAHTFANKQ